ncbi:MAG: hypothetical protein Q9222_005043 [Ikaeria aurantiellina]
MEKLARRQAFDRIPCDHSQGINAIDGFVAGSFVDIERKDVPVMIDEDQYLHELERHLDPVHSGPTPFISMSQHLLRVLTRAFRCSKMYPTGLSAWKVAIIKLSSASSTARAVWKLNAGKHARKAYGEWVALGVVPASDILHIVSIDQLLQTMSETINPFYIDMIQSARNTRSARAAMKTHINRRLNFGDGLAMGELLSCLQIPKRYVDETISLLLWDWKYPEYTDSAWLSNSHFLQGIHYAYLSPSSDFRTVAAAQAVTVEEEQQPNSSRAHDSRHTLETATDRFGNKEKTSDWFANFIDEVEQAAFGGSEHEQYLNQESSSTDAEYTTNQAVTLKKEETPELQILNTVPRCFE